MLASKAATKDQTTRRLAPPPALRHDLPADEVVRSPARDKDGFDAYRISNVTLLVGVVAFQGIGVGAYSLLVPVPHGAALVVIGSFMLLAAAVCAVEGRAFITSRSAPRWSFAISVGSLAVLGLCADLDHGLDSPLLLFVVPTVVGAGLALNLVQVAWCGGLAMGTVAVVGVTGPRVTSGSTGTSMLIVALAAVTMLAILSAVGRSRLEANEAALVATLRMKAEVDALTGCWNHNAFHERLGVEVDRALRYDRPLALLLVCDVDMFKSFNDTWGHLAGDSALTNLGEMLLSSLRSSDVVGRVGGDEFAVILPETAVADACGVAERILAVLRAGPPPTLDVSIGIAGIDRSDPSPLSLFRAADTAMYAAKAQGRGRTATFTPAAPASQP